MYTNLIHFWKIWCWVWNTSINNNLFSFYGTHYYILTEKLTVSMFLTTLFAEHDLNLSILYVTPAYTLFHLYGHWHRWPPATKNKTEIRDHSWTAGSLHPSVYVAVHYSITTYSFLTTVVFHIGSIFYTYGIFPPYCVHLNSQRCSYLLVYFMLVHPVHYVSCSIWKRKSVGYCMVCKIHITWSCIKTVVYAWVLEANLEFLLQ
jgi:hypothetical protein